MVDGSIKVLSLSSVFPNPAEPGRGVFVRSRLLQLSHHVQLKVVAPLPLLDYRNRRGFPNTPASRLDGEVEVLHPRWAYAPFGGFLNAGCLFLQLLPVLRRLRQEFPFDVIDAHFGFPEGVAAALLARALGCPFTVTLRGSELVHAHRPLRRRAMQWALRRADRVMTVSNPLRQFAISLGANPARVRTVPNGIDSAIFFPRDRAACREKYGIPPGCSMVLSAGRLVAEKGHAEVIRALRSVIDGGLPARLYIAGPVDGSPGYERALRARIAELQLHDAVHFLGPVAPAALAELYSAADVFCLASRREGWPNVVHESLGCGTPVVATNVGAVPTLIPSDEYGTVVQSNADFLASALDRALRRTWNRPAIAAWGQSRSWEQVTREVLDEITEVVKQSKAKQKKVLPMGVAPAESAQQDPCAN